MGQLRDPGGADPTSQCGSGFSRDCGGSGSRLKWLESRLEFAQIVDGVDIELRFRDWNSYETRFGGKELACADIAHERRGAAP